MLSLLLSFYFYVEVVPILNVATFFNGRFVLIQISTQFFCKFYPNSTPPPIFFLQVFVCLVYMEEETPCGTTAHTWFESTRRSQMGYLCLRSSVFWWAFTRWNMKFSDYRHASYSVWGGGSSPGLNSIKPILAVTWTWTDDYSIYACYPCFWQLRSWQSTRGFCCRETTAYARIHSDHFPP